jgi:hypothetical protein
MPLSAAHQKFLAIITDVFWQGCRIPGRRTHRVGSLTYAHRNDHDNIGWLKQGVHLNFGSKGAQVYSTF